MERAHRKSPRGRAALGLTAIASMLQRGALALGGFTTGQSGYEGARRNSRRTGNWRAGTGSAAADILPDLDTLRGRSRDLERNNPLARGAIGTKKNGVIGTGLKLRSVIDGKVLGIEDAKRRAELQYMIEREWDLFCAECDFTGVQHFSDMQRTIYGSGRVSGDIGIARRFKVRQGDVYGTKVVLLEGDRVSNPHRRADTESVQGGVALSADGEVTGWWVSDRHPGDSRGVASMKWTFVPRIGVASGLSQMVLAAMIDRPGQVRGVPLFAPIIELLKQLGDYTAAEVKAAINDAYLFAFETPATPVDEDGTPLIVAPDGSDEPGELTLEDLLVTTLDPGSKVEVKKPERPNTAADGFISMMAKQIGAALDLPYELLMMHFGSSFSASRGALEIAFKAHQVDQAWFVRTVLNTVREWQFTEMVARGRFDAPGYFEDPLKKAAWLGCVWIGPTRIQINPAVEAAADKIDVVELKTKSRQQVMTERTGGDFDTKSDEILLEQEKLGANVGAAPVQAKPGKPEDGEDDPNKQPEDQPDQGNGDDE